MGLLLLAAAQGTSDHHQRRRRRRGRRDRGAARAGRARLRRGTMRLKGLGVSPGVGIGTRAGAEAQHARAALPRAGGAGRRASSSGSTTRARDRASRSQHIKDRIADSVGADHAYLFDAQLLMLDDPMLIERAAADHPRRAAQRRVGAAARAASEISALFDRGRGSLPARAQGRRRRRRRPAVHEPARRRRSDRSVHGTRRAAGARRRRDHAVGDRAARLVDGSRRSSPTPAAGPITPPSWRARCASRPSPACTTPAR